MKINPQHSITAFSLSKQALRLFREQLEFLRQHPGLLGLAWLSRWLYYGLFSGAIFIGYHLMLTRSVQLSSSPIQQKLLSYLIIILIFFLANVIALFFNATFSIAIERYKNHQPAALRTGCKTTLKQFRSLFLWLLFKLTLGIGIRIAQKKLQHYAWIQRLTHGLPWKWANYLVVPIILHQGSGPLASIELSSQRMAAIAGPNPRFNFGFGFCFFVARLASLLPLLIGLSLNQSTLIMAGVIISLVSFITVAAVITLLLFIIRNDIYEQTSSSALSSKEATPYFH